jgi:uncharacterized membrane protein YphA (DoxX/SURF4 family)
VIVVAAVILGAIFLAAGVSKIGSSPQWRSQSADLGVPASLAVTVPFIEIVVGALLVAQIARRQVALVAAVLLMAFTVLLVVRLLQGRRPPCACFGAWMTKPIGWGDVARNGVFLALATVLALTG